MMIDQKSNQEYSIFIGNLNEYSRSCERYRALSAILPNVEGLTNTEMGYVSGCRGKASLHSRILHRIGLPLDTSGLNKTLRKKISKGSPRIIWIEKAPTLKHTTLKYVKRRCGDTLIVFYSNDDMSRKHYQSLYLLKSFKYVDVAFTIHGYDASIYKKYGCDAVVYTDRSHSSELLNYKRSDRLVHQVIFVGRFEHARAEMILFLARSGINISVWGSGWTRIKKQNKYDNLCIHGHPIWGEDYRKTVSASKIALNFLRKINNDTTTGRTFEIPALGGFMLSERTCEQTKLFNEGVHAEYFGSKEELLSKTRYYLENERERERIAANGKRLCETGQFTHESLIRGIIRSVTKTTEPKAHFSGMAV